MKKFLLIILSVISLIGGTVTCLAADGTYNYNGHVLPYYDPNFDSSNIVIVEKLSDHPTLIEITGPVVLDSYGSFETVEDCSLYYYELNNSKTEWTRTYAKQVTKGDQSMNVRYNVTNIWWVNKDIYGMDGKLYLSGDENFPPTPTLMEVVGEEMTMTLLPKTMETFSILALCGVGLMALLVGLILFGKVLRPFLRN